MKNRQPAALIDEAAKHVLQARQRIERAVNDGRLPVWVLDTCETWEQAALNYGAAMARLGGSLHLSGEFHSQTRH